jgi:hypothetical protein
MSFKRYFKRTDRRTCYTAWPPLSANTGRLLQRAWSHLSQWKERESVFLADGVPDVNIMLDAGYDGYLHLPLRPPDKANGDTDRQYGVHIAEWPYDWNRIGGVRSASLIPDYVGAPAVMTDIALASSLGSTAATYGDIAVPFAHTYDLIEIPSAAGAWHHAAIRLRKVIMAACSVAPFPPAPALEYDQEQCQSSEFGVGRVIRGHDAGVCEGSLGSLTRLVGDGTGADEDAECLTRRLLFSWAHPVGLWYSTMSAGITVWDETARVLTRNLRDLVAHAHVIEPVLVVTAFPDVELKWSFGGTSWVHTVPAGGYAVPTMITPAMGDVGSNLTVTDGTECDLQFFVSAPTDAEEVVIHTAQLWEGSAWP